MIRCPVCFDKEKFLDGMQQLNSRLSGYDKREEFRYRKCDAENCLCPLEESNYRDENENTDWKVILCSYCGSQGIHVRCGILELDRSRWKCPSCVEVMKNLPSQTTLQENRGTPRIN